jgi:putative component of membrane protein insertase Oxa1/YidC/SpoIIIJ protein YidD
MEGRGEWQPPSTPVAGLKPPRDVTRPVFSLVACIVDLLIPFGLVCLVANALVLSGLLGTLTLDKLIPWLIVAYIVVRFKQIVIWLILSYQRFAPERVRRACVFEPSCSEYMLKSIRLYGLVPGIVKGVARLFRCHDPNGGIDEP